jgi:hypothetical protein
MSDEARNPDMYVVLADGRAVAAANSAAAAAEWIRRVVLRDHTTSVSAYRIQQVANVEFEIGALRSKAS